MVAPRDITLYDGIGEGGQMSRFAKNILLALSLMLAGCSSGPVKLNTTAPVDISELRPRQIASSACGFQLFMVIPIRINSRLQRAYDQLELLADGDPIGEIRLQEYWRYAFVGTTHCTRLVATAYSQ